MRKDTPSQQPRWQQGFPGPGQHLAVALCPAPLQGADRPGKCSHGMYQTSPATVETELQLLLWVWAGGSWALGLPGQGQTVPLPAGCGVQDTAAGAPPGPQAQSWQGARDPELLLPSQRCSKGAKRMG